MAGIFFALRGVHSQIEDIRRVVDQRVEPMAQALTEIIVSTREPIQRLATNFSEISEILRQRTDQADRACGELLERSRLQIIRLDELVSSLMGRLDSTAEALQRSVTAPLREVSAVAAGVRAGLEFLRSRRTATRVREATQDEEMFI
ncbi:MAG TPA: hypothetical protein VGW33_13520 [Terriglobia bacterium]|nr:hypothetical protein [Terriglobia bacterium]